MFIETIIIIGGTTASATNHNKHTHAESDSEVNTINVHACSNYKINACLSVCLLYEVFK